MQFTTRLKFVLAATTLLTPLTIGAAMAADQIEEVIVTAQKRAEKLQSVPIAITALNSAALESRRVATTQDLSAIAPNLTTGSSTAGAGDTTISLRGLPAADTLLSNDNPVGIYIDGVLNARLSGTVLDLVDLDRVEVLRGPQGTLYGRNTTGGAINFQTKLPSDEFHVSEKLGYVNNNGGAGFTSKTTLDTGKIGHSGFKASLAFLYKKVDGFYDNIAQPSDKDPGSENVRAFRGALSFDNGGRFRANYYMYYLSQENGDSASVLTAIGAANKGALIPGTFVIGQHRPDKFNLDKQSTDDTELWLHTFTAEYDVNDHLKIKSITGYRHYDNLNHGPDLDGNGANGPVAVVLNPVTFALDHIGPTNLFYAQNKRQHEQFTQELQFNGQYGDTVAGGSQRFNYTIGGYYFLEHASERNPQHFFFPLAGFNSGLELSNNFAFNTSTESWATFGQASYTPHILDDRLRLTGGLRYSADVKFTNLLQTANGGTQPLFPLSQATLSSTIKRQQSFNNLSYLARVQYFFTDNVNAYVSYSTGYKAGGFNTRSAGLEPYNEETIEALEFGIKADWFNRRLQTNLSLFNNKARNQQVAQFVAGAAGASNLVTNAGKSHYNGIELEILAKPVDGITLNVALGYVDPKYDKYITLDPGNPAAGPIDVHNVAHFGYTSQVTGSAGIQYDSHPMAWIGGGKFQGRVEMSYQSFQNFHPSICYPSGTCDNPFHNFVRSDARTLVNGRVALQDIPLGHTAATMEVALWGKNILDEEYVIQGIDFGNGLNFGQQTFGPPRTGGLEVTFKY